MSLLKVRFWLSDAIFPGNSGRLHADRVTFAPASPDAAAGAVVPAPAGDVAALGDVAAPVLPPAGAGVPCACTVPAMQPTASTASVSRVMWCILPSDGEKTCILSPPRPRHARRRAVTR